MLEVEGMKFFGTAAAKTSVVSFNVGDIHPMDLGTLLDRLGIAIRTGHHCAQPLMARCGVESMARISFGLYNTHEEVDSFIKALQRVVGMFWGQMLTCCMMSPRTHPQLKTCPPVENLLVASRTSHSQAS